jgi:hypothetical protein
MHGGMFAGTATVDYRFLFADQGKQTSVFRFRVKQTDGSLPFPFLGLQQTNENCRFSLVRGWGCVVVCV